MSVGDKWLFALTVRPVGGEALLDLLRREPLVVVDLELVAALLPRLHVPVLHGGEGGGEGGRDGGGGRRGRTLFSRSVLHGSGDLEIRMCDC